MQTTEQKAELARELRAWRGDLTMKQAAELIGIPWRTFEGIEHGRGFSYPQMLKIAMNATKGADNA